MSNDSKLWGIFEEAEKWRLMRQKSIQQQPVREQSADTQSVSSVTSWKRGSVVYEVSKKIACPTELGEEIDRDILMKMLGLAQSLWQGIGKVIEKQFVK